MLLQSILCYFRLLFFFIYYVIKILFFHIFFPRRLKNCDVQDKIIDQWSKKMLEIVDAKVIVQGDTSKLSLEDSYFVLMSNHCSLFDIPVIFQALPYRKIRMVAKVELKKFPLLGMAMEAMNFVFIDRRNMQNAVKNLANAKQLMKEKGLKIWMAPEGTRSKHPQVLQPLKKGGFILSIELGAKILPIWIKGTSTIAPAKSLLFKKGQKVEVFIGQPIDSMDYSLEKKEELISRFICEIRALQ